MNKLRNAVAYIAGVLAFILGALLYRKSQQADSAEAALNNEKKNTEIKEADQDREIAKIHADALVDDYERARAEYNKRSGGAGGDADL